MSHTLKRSSQIGVQCSDRINGIPQNTRKTGIVSAAGKATLEECIVFAREKELSGRNSNIKTCTLHKNADHNDDECRQQMVRRNFNTNNNRTSRPYQSFSANTYNQTRSNMNYQGQRPNINYNAYQRQYPNANYNANQGQYPNANYNTNQRQYPNMNYNTNQGQRPITNYNANQGQASNQMNRNRPNYNNNNNENNRDNRDNQSSNNNQYNRNNNYSNRYINNNANSGNRYNNKQNSENENGNNNNNKNLRPMNTVSSSSEEDLGTLLAKTEEKN